MRKKFLFSLTLAILITATMLTGQAYVLNGYRWSSPPIKYYYDNWLASKAQNSYSGADSGWTGVDADLNFNASYNVYCTEIYESGVTWDGFTSASVSGSYFTSAIVYLNSAKTTTWNSDGARLSVATHEFGHIYGLHENGTTQTIMNAFTWGTNSRYGGYGLTTPQTDDKNGVNYLY